MFGQGAQYGCIQPTSKLRHRFLILDRGSPHVIDEVFNNVPFKAKFGGNVEKLRSIEAVPGMDGFVFSIDPLYKASSGQRWHLQVIYLITSADKLTRYKRDTAIIPTTEIKNSTRLKSRESTEILEEIDSSIPYTTSSLNRKGTNMKVLNLRQSQNKHRDEKNRETFSSTIVIPQRILLPLAICACLILLILAVCTAVIFVARNRINSDRRRTLPVVGTAEAADDDEPVEDGNPLS
ncbi:uncharacterized protein LOC141904543 [Tubulanus polymorphus]|uniref:uncharacterized protein LOC141904543 n=1 Tax=Tubulanus polymorphus TaxID=672921 RepID=UPI003DA5A15D